MEMFLGQLRRTSKRGLGPTALTSATAAPLRWKTSKRIRPSEDEEENEGFATCS